MTVERAEWIGETEKQGGAGVERRGKGRWKGGEAEAEVGLEGEGAKARKEEGVEAKRGKEAGVEDGA